MEVKSGYKQTELGVIPTDWESKPLGQIAQLRSGYAFKSETYDSLGDFKVITIANVQDGFMDAAECNRIISTPSDLQAHQRLRVDDILISMTGNVGRVCRVTEPGCLLNQRVGKLLPKNVDSSLLFYLLSQRHFIGSMATKAKGGAQGNLSVADIIEFQFAVPRTLPEQRAIAAALSDVDALLGGLDRLIAKKRDLKQAAMQQLLTGQTRLPGFSGAWEVKRLDELGKCFAGGTPSTTRPDYWGGDVFWLPSGRIQNNTLGAPSESEITITQRGLSESAAKLIKPFSALVAITGATCANVALLQFEAAANQSVVAIEPFHKADARFIFYSLLMERGQILSRQGGSAQGGVNLKAVKGIEIHCPDHGEQTAIAAVLSVMDAELAALEARRDKTRDLKQAMMQELLTGRTRLVKPEAAHA